MAQEEAVDRAVALSGRIFEATLGSLELFTVYLGDKLGLYAALAGSGPATSVELAEGTNTAERYVREWLEQQAVAGILEVEDVQEDATSRRYSLPAGHDEVLIDPDSLYSMTPLAKYVVAVSNPLTLLLEAFRTGNGVPYSSYGADAREAQAGLNRPLFVNLLGAEWLPSIPSVHRRLQADPPARVADIGCGAGWSCIAIAKAYPKVQVDGFDLDEPSVELARSNAQQAGVSDRITFYARDAADLSLSGQYDLVTAFEMVHDLARPVDVLRTMRSLAGDDGAVIVMDERVGDKFAAPADEVERFMYGFSVLMCLANGMAERPSAETGTVLRVDTLRRYAVEAGFKGIEVLPIEHESFRFYRLAQ